MFANATTSSHPRYWPRTHNPHLPRFAEKSTNQSG